MLKKECVAKQIYWLTCNWINTFSRVAFIGVRIYNENLRFCGVSLCCTTCCTALLPANIICLFKCSSSIDQEVSLDVRHNLLLVYAHRMARSDLCQSNASAGHAILLSFLIWLY